VTLVGALPATAVLMTSAGVPATETRLIASTWKVTVCVAVCAKAAVDRATVKMPAAASLESIGESFQRERVNVRYMRYRHAAAKDETFLIIL
jgi:hypothetical protein